MRKQLKSNMKWRNLHLNNRCGSLSILGGKEGSILNIVNVDYMLRKLLMLQILTMMTRMILSNWYINQLQWPNTLHLIWYWIKNTKLMKHSLRECFIKLILIKLIQIGQYFQELKNGYLEEDECKCCFWVNNFLDLLIYLILI